MNGPKRMFRRSRRTADSNQLAQRSRLRAEELETRIVPTMLHPAGLFVLPDSAIVTPAAVGPTMMRNAYGISAVKFGTVTGDGTGQTIVLIDAYNQPNIASDLASFDSHFGLAAPPSFQVLNENLATSPLPASSISWGLEESLDVEWSHVMAPKANIVLVEANTANTSDLLDVAAKNAGSIAAQISMSFGAGEYSGETSSDSDFTTPGVSYFASSGDSGGRVIYPAASPNVIAVGGTFLKITAGKYAGESGWSGSGGGPSTMETQPSFETSVQSTVNSTGQRGTPDVAMDASPFSGVTVWDTFGFGGAVNGVGGTSLSSPMWAGITAVANQGRVLAGKGTLSNLPADLYSLPASDFHDITTGSNGFAAGPGYDFVTGRGSPKGFALVNGLVGLASGAVVVHSATHTTTGTGGKATVSVAAALALPVPSPNSPLAVTAAPTLPAPTSSVVISAPTGTTIGGQHAALDGPIILAHSVPDTASATSTDAVPDALPSGIVPGAQPAAPTSNGAPAAAILATTDTDSAFADGVLLAGSETTVTTPSDEETGVLDPAAVAGVLAFLGVAWRDQNAETEASDRKRVQK